MFGKRDSQTTGRWMQLSGAARRRGAVMAAVVALALVVAACRPAATPSPEPSPTPSPEATPTLALTEAPPAEMVPSVTVADQAIVDGMVTVAEVVSSGSGWIVIHADANGAPGPILGYSQVAEGGNSDVVVAIDVDGATETLYAMLHTDAGTVGYWEFPEGPDVPVRVDGEVVTPAFAVTGGLPEAEMEMPTAEPTEAPTPTTPAAATEPPESGGTPSVSVADQALVNGTVTIAEVVSEGPGWIVIHADANGGPGPILGYSAVGDGANSDVVVALDLTGVTGTLYAMLHTDAGEAGAFEFPGGPDTPVTVDGQVVTPAFSLEVPSGEAEVPMQGFLFVPKVLVVRAGTAVTFSNRDSVAHTATSDTGVWDSGYLSNGEAYTFTFAEPGVFPYYCIPHGAPGGIGMAGTIVVVP